MEVKTKKIMTNKQKLPEFDNLNKAESMKRLFDLLKSKGMFMNYKNYADWEKKHTTQS